MWSRLALVMLTLIFCSKTEAAVYAWSRSDISRSSARTISDRMLPPRAGEPLDITLVAGDQIGPSFDCGTVVAPLPRLVCSDARLTLVDMQMVQAYQALRAQLGDSLEE